jgi:hypothetical protein
MDRRYADGDGPMILWSGPKRGATHIKTPRKEQNFWVHHMEVFFGSALRPQLHNNNLFG